MVKGLTKTTNKKLKKFKKLLEKRGTTLRIPVAPPGFAHKDKNRYDRKRSKKDAKKEIKENT